MELVVRTTVLNQEEFFAAVISKTVEIAIQKTVKDKGLIDELVIKTVKLVFQQLANIEIPEERTKISEFVEWLSEQKRNFVNARIIRILPDLNLTYLDEVEDESVLRYFGFGRDTLLMLRKQESIFYKEKINKFYNHGN